MNAPISEIGLQVRQRRRALGLSQERLARLSHLSRVTVNQLETRRLEEIGVSKLAALMDLLGLRLQAEQGRAPERALLMATRSASVSYRTPLSPVAFSKALIAGTLPDTIRPQVATLIDEAPLPVLIAAIEEVARESEVSPQRLWRHLVDWARELRSPRPAWASQ
jgi:transcriptional regulator with XRE-family HTH domain